MRTNEALAATPVYTHGGAVARRVSVEKELRRTLMTCMLWEPPHYESGDSIAARIAELVPKVAPEAVPI